MNLVFKHVIGILLRTLLEIPISLHELLAQGRNVQGRRFSFSPEFPWSSEIGPGLTLHGVPGRAIDLLGVPCPLCGVLLLEVRPTDLLLAELLLRLEGMLFHVVPLAAPLPPVAGELSPKVKFMSALLLCVFQELTG